MGKTSRSYKISVRPVFINRRCENTLFPRQGKNFGINNCIIGRGIDQKYIFQISFSKDATVYIYFALCCGIFNLLRKLRDRTAEVRSKLPTSA